MTHHDTFMLQRVKSRARMTRTRWLRSEQNQVAVIVGIPADHHTMTAFDRARAIT